ncbi:MAG: thioredoxin domain-containing protein [Chromatiaceae bacterium]|nr:thioredoxin domain-containing protein [Gammaproteobacteria bacterium]MCP5300683.1 thioredoxin domain-containing protein [Chromatiaceae bacterium]MCP5422755.1 thioredoxin domain-containing protein [Chromatiaceae bacterium]
MSSIRKRLFSLLFIASTAGAVTPGPAPDWQPYAPTAFARAAADDRLILLDLVAVWCHWCHVMDATTYSDPRVVDRLRAGYVAVRADHDARPDLAERYRDYGWPATVILRADGTELVKRAGYIEPEAMLALLERARAGAADVSPQAPDAVAATATSAVLTDALRDELERRHLATDDPVGGGLDLMQRFLDPDAVEWDLHLAARGDEDAERRARRHLDAALALIDPAFGGAYQYSTHGDWAHPHYEKIMRTQLACLRAYSLGHAILGDPRYRLAGEQVVAWLRDFMQADNGGFHTSQDADLEQGIKAHAYFALDRAQRLARGLPRIDRHQYADANGMAIEGLVTLYGVTGDRRMLGLAVGALDWVLRNRRDGEGGFRHGERDVAGPYLADTLYMGRAFLALYEVSGQRAWLDQAVAAADFIDARFRRPDGGLLSAVDNGTPLRPLAQIDQNIHAARFFYALAEQTGDARHAALAAHVMRYLNTPAIARSRVTDAGILLADRDRRFSADSKQSLTLIIFNKKDDAA